MIEGASIVPVISYDSVLGMFGPEAALVMYEALTENLRELTLSREDEKCRPKTLSGLVDEAVNVRRTIMRNNEDLVLPIPVLRICVISEDESPIIEESLQSTSHCYIPIFVSGKLTCEGGVRALRNMNIRECLLAGREGHYVLDIPVEVERGKSSRRATVNKFVTYLAVGYVCCVSGDHLSLFDGMENVLARSYYGGMTYVYGSNEKLSGKLGEMARENKLSCAIHACSDFTVRGRSNYVGNGVRCVRMLAEMAIPGQFYVTEAASYYIEDFSPKDYVALEVRTIGLVYVEKQQ